MASSSNDERPAARNPREQNSLRARNPWDRVVCLANVQPQDLFANGVLKDLISLIDDTTAFVLPGEPYTDVEKPALKLCHVGENMRSRWLAVVPPSAAPDARKEGNTKYVVSDMAMRVLLKAARLPCQEPDSFNQIVEAYKGCRKAPHLVRHWVDVNFRRFAWKDEGAAVTKFCKTIINSGSEPMILDWILKDADDQVMLDVGAIAANKGRVDVLEAIHRRDRRNDASAEAILEVLSKNPVPTPEAAQLVAKIGSKEDFRSDMFKVLKKMEGVGVGMAAGWAALWGEKGADSRFVNYLNKDFKKSDQNALHVLVSRANLYSWPNTFPEAEALAHCNRDWVMRGLCDAWSEEMSTKQKERSLRRLVEASSSPRMAYEPLFELGKLKVLHRDPKLSAQFWAAVEDAMTSTDRYSLAPEFWDIEANPLVYFSDDNTRPAGFDEAVKGFLKADLITASVFAYAMRPGKFRALEIKDSATQNLLKKRAEEEIEATERDHRAYVARKERGIRHPSETVLWALRDRWTPLRATLTKIDGTSSLTKKMEVLMNLPLPRLLPPGK